MEELVRTRAGSFRLEEAFTLGEIEKKHEEKKLMSSILSVEEVLSEYPVCEVKPHADRLIYNGNPFISISNFTIKAAIKYLTS